MKRFEEQARQRAEEIRRQWVAETTRRLMGREPTEEELSLMASHVPLADVYLAAIRDMIEGTVSVGAETWPKPVGYHEIHLEVPDHLVGKRGRLIFIPDAD